MKVTYDTYYIQENLFGNPYPELIEFYSQVNHKGKLLDLGCGQGRDSIALAKLGFDVIGVDHSKVGIEQLNKIAVKENLSLTGIVEDLYTYSNFKAFEHILLNSLFHFGKNEKAKEIEFLNRLFSEVNPNTIITICIQKAGQKLKTLMSVISKHINVEVLAQTELIYLFEDKASGHRSETRYEMVSIKSIKE